MLLDEVEWKRTTNNIIITSGSPHFIHVKVSGKTTMVMGLSFEILHDPQLLPSNNYEHYTDLD
jgi:hypothetical protein